MNCEMGGCMGYTTIAMAPPPTKKDLLAGLGFGQSVTNYFCE
jgi:hypothetical protein